jgi:hypothetical protein
LPVARIQLTQVLNAGLGGFAQHYLDAVVAGLGGGVLLAAADDFTVGGYVVETVLAGLEERLETLGLAVGFDALDAVFTAGFSRVAFTGLDDFAVVGAQVILVLAAAREDLEDCHWVKQGYECQCKLGGLQLIFAAAASISDVENRR